MFDPVHVTGRGVHGPVLRHAGHIAPFVQSGLERSQYSVVGRSLMAQMPAPAPVIWLSPKSLQMCARKECEGGERSERTTRVKNANEAGRAEGVSRLWGGAARGRGEGRRRETHK